MTEIAEFKFKNQDPEYYENRKKTICEQTKARYSNDKETKERVKARSKQQNQEMREALKLMKLQQTK